LDFNSLRSAYLALAGGTNTPVALENNGTTVEVLIDERPVASFEDESDSQE